MLAKVWRPCPERRGQGSWAWWAWGRDGFKRFSSNFQCFWGGHWEDSVRVFIVLSGRRMRVNGHYFKQQRIRLDVRKKNFHVTTDEECSWLQTPSPWRSLTLNWVKSQSTWSHLTADIALSRLGLLRPLPAWIILQSYDPSLKRHLCRIRKKGWQSLSAQVPWYHPSKTVEKNNRISSPYKAHHEDSPDMLECDSKGMTITSCSTFPHPFSRPKL